MKYILRNKDYNNFLIDIISLIQIHSIEYIITSFCRTSSCALCLSICLLKCSANIELV